jgi:hypothetical protein
MESGSSPGSALPRIFVSIPSYRDPECQRTLEDLFSKAAHPNRIFVGVCLQVDPATDTECLVDTGSWPGRVRVKQLHWSEARSQLLSLARLLMLVPGAHASPAITCSSFGAERSSSCHWTVTCALSSAGTSF